MQNDPKGTIEELVKGAQYRVVQSFTDYYGNMFLQDKILHFKERYFLPHHGGHTIVFNECMLYLKEEQNQDIIDHFSEYIVSF